MNCKVSNFNGLAMKNFFFETRDKIATSFRSLFDMSSHLDQAAVAATLHCSTTSVLDQFTKVHCCFASHLPYLQTSNRNLLRTSQQHISNSYQNWAISKSSDLALMNLFVKFYFVWHPTTHLLISVQSNLTILKAVKHSNPCAEYIVDWRKDIF